MLSRLFILFIFTFTSLNALGKVTKLERLEMESSVEQMQKAKQTMANTNDWSLADKFLDEAKLLLERIDHDLTITLKQEIISVLIQLTRYDEANTLLQKTLQIAKLSNSNPATIAQLHYEMGRILGRQGNYAQSLAAFQKAYAIHKENNLAILPNHLSAIATITHFLGNNEKALTLYEELQTIVEPNSPIMPRILVAKGAILIELQDYQRALTSFQEAQKLSDKTGYKAPNLAQNWGYLYVLTGEQQKAQVLLKKALAEYKRNHRKSMISVSQKSLGESYLRQGNTKQAIFYLSKAYKGLKDKGLVKQELELYPIYIEALEVSGQYFKALTYFKEYKILSDKTIDLESKKYAESLQANFDLKLEQERVKQLEKHQAIQQKSLNSLETANRATQKLNHVMTLTITLLTLLSVSVITLLVYRKKINVRLKDKHTQIQALNEQLKQLSFYDPLTQLSNRHYLNELLPQEIASAKKHTTENNSPQWMLLLLDIDHFKKFNDTYGHIEGDKALQHVAKHLKSCARQSDIVARWGGEEFIWLCRDIDFSQIDELFQRLQFSLQQDKLAVDQELITLTFSAGATELLLSDQLDDVWITSIELADAALYKAKRDGRQRLCVYQVKNYQINTGKLAINKMIEQEDIIQLS